MPSLIIALVIDSKVEVVTKHRPDPVDRVAREEQWSHLQQIRWQVPYIDFLKQEHFDAWQELQADANLPAIQVAHPAGIRPPPVFLCL